MGIPANGKEASFEAADIWRIVGGKLADRWDIFDQPPLLQLEA